MSVGTGMSTMTSTRVEVRRRCRATRTDSAASGFELTQYATLNFSGRRHGKCIDIFDFLRIFVGRKSIPYVFLKGGGECIFVLRRIFGGQHNERLHNGTTLGVGLGHDGDIGDGGMVKKAVFNLARADPVTG
jgi:hypothetical protein